MRAARPRALVSLAHLPVFQENMCSACMHLATELSMHAALLQKSPSHAALPQGDCSGDVLGTDASTGSLRRHSVQAAQGGWLTIVPICTARCRAQPGRLCGDDVRHPVRPHRGVRRVRVPWAHDFLPPPGRAAGRRGVLARAGHKLPRHPQPHQHVPAAPGAHHQVRGLCLDRLKKRRLRSGTTQTVGEVR